MEYKCLECGSVFTDKHTFCPNCGHKMVYTDEVKIEEEEIKASSKAEEVIATENEEKLDKEEAVIATPIVEETKAKPVENAKVHVVEGNAKKETKPVPRKLIHIFNIVTSAISILFVTLLLTLPIYFTYMTYEGETYPIAFGFIDFYVYKIYHAFQGHFNFMALGFNSLAYITALFCFVVTMTSIKEIVTAIKGLKHNSIPHLPGNMNQRRTMFAFIDGQTSNTLLCLLFPIVLFIETKIFGNIIALLFEDINLWAFIPLTTLLIPMIGIMIARLILIKKVK